MMLGSLKSPPCSSNSTHTGEADPPDQPPENLLTISRFSYSSGAHQTRRLLFHCAELVALSDFPAAHRLVSFLLANSSPYGDSTDRLVYHFATALSVRIQHSGTHVSGNIYMDFNLVPGHDDDDYLQSCYIWLNQTTPFIRFSHLTANQAILDAADQQGQEPIAIHLLDLDLAHGLQWPPLMQALADRYSGPVLKITGCGCDINTLNRTGDRLTRFANSLGLRFHFQPLLLDENPAALALRLRSTLSLVSGETLAVNCVFCLHKYLTDEEDPRDILLLLGAIKELNPMIVTVSETESDHNNPVFIRRFTAAVDHYGAVFESLEATLPPNSRERVGLENTWFGREILDIVAARGRERRLRHHVFDVWEGLLRRCGFTNVPLSGFALSQAKLLLKLHYPSEGYEVKFVNDSLFLGWKNRPLFSVSSWR